MPSSLRDLLIIMYLSPAVNGFSGVCEYCALPIPIVRCSDSSAHFLMTSMCPLCRGWKRPTTRE